MKKQITAMVLAAVLVLGMGLPGCSTPAENEEPESSSQSSSSQPQEEASEPEEPESENPSSSGSSTVIELTPSSQAESTSSDGSQAAGLTGALVTNDGAVFGTGENILGTDADLAAWNAAISERDAVSRVLVSTWNTERDLTADEVNTVLDTLEGLSPTVMAELGNPATGGATNMAAFDQNGNRLWSATLNTNWLIVRIAGDNTGHILEINESDATPISDIAG